MPTLRFTSMKVSSAVRSTARREVSEGGFSSMISWLFASPVRMRKSRTALVMLASLSKAACRRSISPADSAYLGSL